MDQLTTFWPLFAFLALSTIFWQLLSYEKSKPKYLRRLELIKHSTNAHMILGNTLETWLYYALTRVDEEIQRLRPRRDLTEKRLKLFLSQAGMSSSHAVPLYCGLKAACACFGVPVSAGLNILIGGGWLVAIVVGIGTVLICYLVPTLAISRIRRARQKELDQTLPNLLDLLGVAIETGLGPDAALREVNRELGYCAPTLNQELTMCLGQLELGRDRREAYHDLSQRCGTREIAALMNTLIQSHRFGTGIAVSIREQSKRTRIQQKQLAEQRAHQLGCKLIFPLVLFIFPGVFTVLVGPAAILIIRDMLALG